MSKALNLSPLHLEHKEDESKANSDATRCTTGKLGRRRVVGSNFEMRRMNKRQENWPIKRDCKIADQSNELSFRVAPDANTN